MKQTHVKARTPQTRPGAKRGVRGTKRSSPHFSQTATPQDGRPLARGNRR